MSLYWAVEGIPEGGAASLAPYRQSLPGVEAPAGADEGTVVPDLTRNEGGSSEGCPRRNGRILVSQSSGLMVPARCGSNRCVYCLPRNARVRSQVIAYAQPERAILLTQVGDSWPEIQARMNRVRYDLAKALGPFEWLWHVEPNPAGTGHHVHAWQRGKFVPQKTLAAVADRRGMGGVAFVNRIKDRQAVGQYGLKGIGYGLKNVHEGFDAAVQYLDTNGGRLTHQSRRFFGVLGAGGLPVKDATRAALAMTPGGDPGPWTVTFEARS